MMSPYYVDRMDLTSLTIVLGHSDGPCPDGLQAHAQPHTLDEAKCCSNGEYQGSRENHLSAPAAVDPEFTEARYELGLCLAGDQRTTRPCDPVRALRGRGTYGGALPAAPALHREERFPMRP